MKPATSKSKLLVFDFDGVIADSNEQMLEAIHAACKKLKVTVPSVEELRTSDARVMLKKMGLNTLRVLQMVRFCQNYLTKMPSPALIEGMRELLAEAKSTSVLGIVSTSTKKRIEDFISVHKLEGNFDFVRSSVALWGKDRVLWELSCEYPALKRLYVGDEERDIISGQKAGYAVISVAWGAKSEAFLASYRPDYSIGSVAMFRDLLKAFD